MTRRKPRTESDGWAAAGVPAYVKGWCCKAREGTMRQGFKDVGYLLVPHVLTFRPTMVSRRVWREEVRVLAREIGAHKNDARAGRIIFGIFGIGVSGLLASTYGRAWLWPPRSMEGFGQGRRLREKRAHECRDLNPLIVSRPV